MPNPTKPLPKRKPRRARSDNAPADQTSPPDTTEVPLSGKLLLLGSMLRRSASQLYRRRFDLLAEEWRIVALLGPKESLALTDLAARAGMRKSQLSRGAASLTAKGLVSRAASAADAREARLHLTPAGRRVHEGIITGAAERSASLVDGMGAGDLARLDRIVDRLIERAHQLK